MALPASYARLLLGVIAIALTAVEFTPLVLGRSLYEITFLGIHVGATTAIAFLIIGWKRRRTADEAVPVVDLLLALLALACTVYFAMQGFRVSERIEGVDAVYPLDSVFGVILILLLLEAARRVAGLALTVIAVLFIAYVFLGPYLPGGLYHRGLSFERFIDLQVLSTQAIFGTPISASAHMVFYFVLVGAFLERSGAGQLFVDLAYCVTGRAWGGAGKASVVSSGLFGTVSGSAVANVLVDGIITIPLMKRTGFSGPMAGAIEATASTGGQLAPPVMGAAAFILADIVGVSYASVAFAAIVPAILYYVSLFIVVDTHSRRMGLGPSNALPVAQAFAGFRERWHILIPLGVMIYLLTAQYSLMLVGAVSLVTIVILSWARRSTRMNLKAMYEGIVNGARGAAEVAIPSAVAGIIVGVLVQTGMALHLQRWLLDVAGNSLMVSLFGAMILTIIFGMGMPTSAAYLIAAVLVAPALQQLGIPALAAHLFIFYFAVLSMVTPPVALAAYAAAGISGASLWTTGLLAFLIAVPGFLIPYAFVFDQALLLQGDPLHIVWVIAAAAIGVAAFSAGTGGYLFGPLSRPARVMLFLFAPLLIDPRLITDLIGGIGVGLVLAWQIWRYKLRARSAAEPAG
ncbi:MAG TPA: TRAP transporter fused permease subunit [Burkholderiales bacterium]|nr:TRAP transporter fused permease subunit [Burkholderiales bacterium]